MKRLWDGHEEREAYMSTRPYEERAVNEIVQMMPLIHEKFIRSFERSTESIFTQLQHKAMIFIINEGPLPMNKIATRMAMSKQQLTRFIDTLVQRNMLRRFNKENDRRTIYIEATEEGRDKVFSHTYMMRQQHVDRISNIPEDAKCELYESAKKFKDLITKYWGTSDDK